MKHFITLLLVCFMCQSCFAQEELPVLEVLDEAPEMSTGERLKPLIEKGLEQQDGYELPKDVLIVIAGLEKQFGKLTTAQKNLNLQLQVIKEKKARMTEASLAEIRMFLASKGVPRGDMPRWRLDGNKIKRK